MICYVVTFAFGVCAHLGLISTLKREWEWAQFWVHQAALV